MSISIFLALLNKFGPIPKKNIEVWSKYLTSSQSILLMFENKKLISTVHKISCPFLKLLALFDKFGPHFYLHVVLAYLNFFVFDVIT